MVTREANSGALVFFVFKNKKQKSPSLRDIGFELRVIADFLRQENKKQAECACVGARVRVRAGRGSWVATSVAHSHRCSPNPTASRSPPPGNAAAGFRELKEIGSSHPHSESKGMVAQSICIFALVRGAARPTFHAKSS